MDWGKRQNSFEPEVGDERFARASVGEEGLIPATVEALHKRGAHGGMLSLKSKPMG